MSMDEEDQVVLLGGLLQVIEEGGVGGTVKEPPVPPTQPMTSPDKINHELEAALRKALNGGDTGKVCKILGDAFCLPSRSPNVLCDGYESDTTAPGDQDQTSSESGNGSETGGDGSTAMAQGASNSTSADSSKSPEKAVRSNVSAIASAAEVSSWSPNALFRKIEAFAGEIALSVFVSASLVVGAPLKWMHSGYVRARSPTICVDQDFPACTHILEC